MDSQDSSGAPPQPHHHHQQPPLQRHHQHPQNIMVGPPPHQSHPQQQQQPPLQHPNSYSFQSPVTANNIMPHQHHQQQQQHQQQLQQQQQSSRFPFNPMMTSPPGPKMQMDYSDGGGGGGVATSSETGGGGGGGASGFSIDTAKKKRGRPRKYSPDGAGSSIALGLSPTTPVSNTAAAATDSGGGGGADALSSEGPAKKHRGRPPGSGKKQLDALGTPGVGFTPHVITVKAGEDIASKLMAFSQQGPRTVCILSANGAICNVTLRQPATSGGTVTYEGRFEIISLSGSFLLQEDGGGRNRTCGLSVSLAGSDGRVLGGGVAGVLMAASPVQIIVGSFIQDGKKPKSVPAIAPAPNMLSFGNATTEASPPSQGGSSDSSDDNGSPMNQGAYMSAGQPMQNVQMYANMGWGNSAMKMHPN